MNELTYEQQLTLKLVENPEFIKEAARTYTDSKAAWFAVSKQAKLCASELAKGSE